MLLSKNEYDKKYVHCYGDDSVRVEPLLYYNEENIDRLGGMDQRSPAWSLLLGLV